jgi:hypothetical protein
MATKTKQFNVYSKILVESAVEVSATSLEEAVQKAKALDFDAFVEVLGEHIDSDYRLTGVFEL